MLKHRKLSLLLALVFGFSLNTFAQDYWEPVTNITGYFSTEFNYFDDLADYDYDYGASLSEAGLLINYRPVSKLTLKGVFVYRPGYKFDKMLNELSGEYKINPYLNVKVGRFLQSLSPTNTFYYAPVNTSATLPILVSNNEFFPLNIDGISFNGTTGNDFKIKYDVFAGTYTNALFKKTGGIGFFGNEVNYFNSLNGEDPIEFDDFRNLAIAGTIGFSYKNYVDVGLGYFNPNNEVVYFGDFAADELYPGSPAGPIRLEVIKKTFGLNFKLQYNNTKLIGEGWKAHISTPTADFPDYDSYYAELSHRVDKITPYLRYENQTAGSLEYARITAGVNYKPSFETTVKAEYLGYLNETDDIHGAVVAFIYSF
jgi:hypothetical protein